MSNPVLNSNFKKEWKEWFNSFVSSSNSWDYKWLHHGKVIDVLEELKHVPPSVEEFQKLKGKKSIRLPLSPRFGWPLHQGDWETQLHHILSWLRQEEGYVYPFPNVLSISQTNWVCTFIEKFLKTRGSKAFFNRWKTWHSSSPFGEEESLQFLQLLVFDRLLRVHKWSKEEIEKLPEWHSKNLPDQDWIDVVLTGTSEQVRSASFQDHAFPDYTSEWKTFFSKNPNYSDWDKKWVLNGKVFDVLPLVKDKHPKHSSLVEAYKSLIMGRSDSKIYWSWQEDWESRLHNVLSWLSFEKNYDELIFLYSQSKNEKVGKLLNGYLEGRFKEKATRWSEWQQSPFSKKDTNEFLWVLAKERLLKVHCWTREEIQTSLPAFKDVSEKNLFEWCEAVLNSPTYQLSSLCDSLFKDQRNIFEGYSEDINFPNEPLSLWEKWKYETHLQQKYGNSVTSENEVISKIKEEEFLNFREKEQESQDIPLENNFYAWKRWLLSFESDESSWNWIWYKYDGSWVNALEKIQHLEPSLSSLEDLGTKFTGSDEWYGVVGDLDSWTYHTLDWLAQKTLSGQGKCFYPSYTMTESASNYRFSICKFLKLRESQYPSIFSRWSEEDWERSSPFSWDDSENLLLGLILGHLRLNYSWSSEELLEFREHLERISEEELISLADRIISVQDIESLKKIHLNPKKDINMTSSQKVTGAVTSAITDSLKAGLQMAAANQFNQAAKGLVGQGICKATGLPPMFLEDGVPDLVLEILSPVIVATAVELFEEQIPGADILHAGCQKAIAATTYSKLTPLIESFRPHFLKLAKSAQKVIDVHATEMQEHHEKHEAPIYV